MTSFKIYTENKPDALGIISGIVTPYYDGFNITPSYGVWKGVPEPCLIVEIITEDIDRATIGEVAETIRIALKQDAVLISETKLSGLALAEDDGITDLNDQLNWDRPDKGSCCDCENCTECGEVRR